MKVMKKTILKKNFFVPKLQIFISSQNVSRLSFTILAGQSLSVATPNRKLSKE